MSKELINGQIIAKQDEINRLEEEAKNKHASAKNEVEEKYDDRINKIKDQLQSEQGDLEEAVQEKIKWTEKVKELTISTKNFTKDLTNLKKQKDSEFSTKIKAIEKEEKEKKKVVLGEIKQLEKEKKELEKNEAKE